jgi:hypothetical protein
MTWEVQRVAAVEDAIHSTLEARGSKRQAPGAEWFDTTLGEVTSIVDFVQPAARAIAVKELARSNRLDSQLARALFVYVSRVLC